MVEATIMLCVLIIRVPVILNRLKSLIMCKINLTFSNHLWLNICVCVLVKYLNIRISRKEVKDP